MAESEEEKLSKLEHIKEGSRQLRGTIVEELSNGSDHFEADTCQLLKHHGSYQQDNRDLRKAKNPDGTPKGKTYSCMVRTRVPGGKVTAEQFLAELDLCDRYGSGTIRITSRQGLQLHGVVKESLRETIREINRIKLTTFAACGDVERNVMCCPAPYRNNAVREQMQEMADRVAEHFKPKSTAYYDIWLEDENGQRTNVAEFQPVEEPIYGARYLPRKFKTAFALPEDNCIDLYSQDLGLLAIVEDDAIVGYNVLVGGGMGVTPSAKKTFPALAKRMTFITPERVVPLAEAIVKVQRDFGNRADRKVARLKYLIANRGLDWFKGKVEDYFGSPLPEPHPTDVSEVDDHLGWHEQGDGRLFLGVNIENGRIKDEGDVRIKSGLRAVLERFGMKTRLTALQSVILCNIEPSDRQEVELLLADHGIRPAGELSLVRRYSLACPAMPTCGLAVSDSERVLPGLIDDLEAELGRLGLRNERISLHMTGCPNGCVRPYSPDIGLVGKTLGKYTVFLGGNTQATRLAYIYKDLVPLDEVVSTLSGPLACYKADRTDSESFGDFCARMGRETLLAHAETGTAS